MSDEQNTLKRAKALIIAKKYDEARRVLTAIQADPNAQIWLAKLDEIARRDSSTVELDASLDPFPSQSVYPNRLWNPINPVALLLITFLLIPIIPLFLIWNWKRYGKIGWAIQTFIFGFAGLLGVLSNGFLLDDYYDDWASKQGISIALTSIIFFIAYWLGIAAIQYSLYRQVYNNDQPLTQLDHPQLFRRWAKRFSILATLVAVGAAIAVASTSFETTFENDFIRFAYAFPNWDEVTSSDTQYCPKQTGDSCFFALQNEHTILSFFAITIDEPIDVFQLDEALWSQAQIEAHDYDVHSVEQIEIDGIVAFRREYTSAGQDNDNYYMTIYLTHSDYIVQIDVWSTDKEAFDNDRNHYMYVIDSIDFK
jgi:hypothetical protein